MQVRKLSSLIRSLPLPPHRLQTTSSGADETGAGEGTTGGLLAWAGSPDREEKGTWAMRGLSLRSRQCDPFSPP